MGPRPDLEAILFDEQIPFNQRALHVFAYQRQACAPYQRFCDALGVGINDPSDWTEIPCMPVAAFKEVQVCTMPVNEQTLLFRSSATGLKRSRHWVLEPALYRQSLLSGFVDVFGSGPFTMWTYLPGYQENPDSSLIYMMEELLSSPYCARATRLPLDRAIPTQDLEAAARASHPLMVWGAAFGLLDLLDLGGPYALPEQTILIETGGMKTRRRERSRDELHQTLSEGFGVPRHRIYSEYGMAEMLSQAYLKSDFFELPHWCRVQEYKWYETRHPLAFIDLANLYSCSFLLIGDYGKVHSERAFIVDGRIDPTDYRGCNFLLERDG
jgi:hypothetical protein